MSCQLTGGAERVSSTASRLAVGLVVAGLLMSGCGAPSSPPAASSTSSAVSSLATEATASVDSTVSSFATEDTASSTSTLPPLVAEEAACSATGNRAFPASFLDGPDLSPEEFVATPVGATLEAFFDGEPGVDSQYRRATGFSIVTDTLVLGYIGQVPDSRFSLTDGAVTSFGGCHPRWVLADLVATPWEPPAAMNILARSVPIGILGGECWGDGEQRLVTELVRVDVEETDDQVTITAWTRDPDQGACEGVMIAATAELASPLGNRTLLDGGAIPAEQMVFVASEGPVPTTTIPEDNVGSDRLNCGQGIVVEERVADSGQEPLEIAQAAAPAVVEVEPTQPLWWSGLNANGAVIVELALGDIENADYQVWTCDPPLGSDAEPVR